MKDEVVRRAIYINEMPFAKRDELRMGVGALQEVGFVIELWEVGPIFLPAAQRQWVDPPVDSTVRRFTETENLLASCRQLTKSDVVILLCGIYTHENRSHQEMMKAVSQSDACLVATAHGSVPYLANRFRRRTLPELLKTAINLIRISWQLPRGRHSIRGRIYRRLLGMRALDFIFVDVTVSSIDPIRIGPETKIKYIHSWDYDKILGSPISAAEDHRTAVLLDHMGFGHPDGLIFSVDFTGLDEESYFRAVRNALDEFEKVSGLVVEIAAHPRAEPGSLDRKYGSRIVRHLETAEAISDSRAVIVMNATTSVGLAVALQRPMIVIQSKTFQAGVINETDFLAGLLGLPVVNLESSVRDWCIPTIDSKKYESYLQKYVKKPDTPEIPFWEVVADAVQSFY